MRLKPEVRKEQILDAAVTLAERQGYMLVKRDDIADMASCATGLVTRYLGTMATLRRAIMSAAIARQNLTILAQGLAMGDAKARSAPQELRARATAFSTSGE